MLRKLRCIGATGIGRRWAAFFEIADFAEDERGRVIETLAFEPGRRKAA